MRDYVKFILKAGAILCLLLCFSLYSMLFGMDFMDQEGPLWFQQRDYIRSGNAEADGIRCLILGDSRAKAGIMPRRLGEGVYNLSLSGVSGVELYYALENYLKHAPAPDSVVIAVGPYHFTMNNSFWKRTMYFHYLSPGEAMELFREADGMAGETFLGEGYRYEYLSYLLYLPNVYGNALAKNDAGRGAANEAIYRQLEADRGYYFYGQSPELGPIPEEVEGFEADPLIRLYTDKLLELCHANGITVYLETLPVAESAFDRVPQSYLAGYQAHLEALAADHPEIHLGQGLRGYPDALYGEASHLNREGAEAYTEELMAAYPAVFAG